MPHDLHCYDYVNQPYERVREQLLEDPRRLLQRARRVAAARAQALRAQLRAVARPLELAAQIEIRVSSIEGARSLLDDPSRRFLHELRAERASAAFPVMHAILRAYPLTPTETQLELEGTYAPPLAVAGEGIAIDDISAVMGRRIAEASMLRFIQEVAVHLRAELAPAVDYAS
ncbi:MAG TPA: hypothetical protein VK932_01305 [Kofleriaceae bacterium]|nr:hypothetical protein [Kofleriaceae bacterium]